MVVVSHLFFFLAKNFRGRCDSNESHRPLYRIIYFPTTPFFIFKFYYSVLIFVCFSFLLCFLLSIGGFYSCSLFDIHLSIYLWLSYYNCVSNIRSVRHSKLCLIIFIPFFYRNYKKFDFWQLLSFLSIKISYNFL